MHESNSVRHKLTYPFCAGILPTDSSKDELWLRLRLFVSSALQSIKNLFSCEDFSEKSYASLFNRARAREAIKP